MKMSDASPKLAEWEKLKNSGNEKFKNKEYRK